MTDLAPERTQFQAENREWMRDTHGMTNTIGVTLDGDLFPAAQFPAGTVPSGTRLGVVTASRLAGPYAGRLNERQTVGLGAATAGTVTITFDGATTAAIAFNSNAAAVQAALEGLPNLSPGDIVVSGGPLPGVVTLDFGGTRAGQNVPEVTVTPTGLTGGTVTVTTTQQGGATVADGRDVCIGHLLDSQSVRAGRRVSVAVLDHGGVLRNKLPNPTGLTAAQITIAEGQLPRVRYSNG